MAERDDQATKAALGISVAAAIASAIALTRKAAAAPPGGVVQLPQQLWDLIIAIASSLVNVDTDLDTLIAELSKLSISVQGWPANADGTRSFSILCVVAATPYQANDMIIPDGMALLIKASPLNAIGSLIFVGRTPAECINPNSAWPLIPNESIPYFIKDAKAIYVSTNVAGSIAIFTAEQRS